MEASSANKAFIALLISSLDTGPTVTYDTGILDSFKKDNKASKEPKVEAATPTPWSDNYILFFTFSKSFSTNYSANIK